MSTRYTREHEWIRLEGDTALVGISNYAQEQLGDIVHIELPAVGTKLDKGAEAAVVESVKAASEVYAPVAGEVVEINAALADEPAAVNQSAEAAGWFIKLKVADGSDLDSLMDSEAYQAFLGTI